MQANTSSSCSLSRQHSHHSHRHCSSGSRLASGGRAPTRGATRARAAPKVQQQQQQVYLYTQLEIETQPGISLHNITPALRAAVAQARVAEGCVHVLSRHTTTAVTINEDEARLRDDIRQYLRKLAPPTEPYLHNDLHLREAPPGWPGGWEAWAAQEPENAHSHLLSMVLGNTLTVPVTGGQLALGTWQSVMLVELDGPRPRTVGVQVVGLQSAAAATGSSS